MDPLERQQKYALLTPQEDRFHDDKEQRHTSSRNSSESLIDEHDRIIQPPTTRRRCRCCNWQGWGRFLSYLLIILLGVFVTHVLDSIGHFFTAQTYLTDFNPAIESVEMEMVRFTGSPEFDENGLPYFEYKRKYVGKTTKAIDNAWTELLQHRYFLVSDEEAKEAWGEGYEKYYRHPFGYVAGLDVLHNLHCLDTLRRAIHEKDYHPDGNVTHDTFYDYHVDHCIDIIRQSLQCHSDLTLIPTKWRDGLGRDFIDSDQVHTCRNFEKIKQWSLDRYIATDSDRYALVDHFPPKGHEESFVRYLKDKAKDEGVETVKDNPYWRKYVMKVDDVEVWQGTTEEQAAEKGKVGKGNVGGRHVVE